MAIYKEKMRIYLIGAHLSHSYSREIHAALSGYDYRLKELEEHALEDFLRTADFDGLNVTIPYKKAVIPYLARLSCTAARIGAVNTIVREGDGSLTGYNTDYDGLADLIADLGVPLSGKKALVLGSGGASGTAVAVLEDLGATPIVISRRGENNYENLGRHADASLIINTTPVGMYPQNGEAPLSLAAFPALEGVLDLIYNPARTALLLEAEARGIPYKSGLLMLVSQARRAAELFTDSEIPRERVAKIVATLSRDAENIVLIGMPGCGKSTLGALLAKALDRPFADTDALIEKAAGQTIPEIFEKEGEVGFRARERAVLRAVGREKGQVIATGGGCVTVAENYASLHQNGKIIFLDIAPAGLSTEGRPLSQGRSPEQLFRERLPLYRKFADVTVPITRDIEENLKLLKEIVK